MLKISIVAGNGSIRQEAAGEKFVNLVYRGCYWPGDSVLVETDKAPCFITARLDDTMDSALLYLREGAWGFPVPFFEKKLAYNPKAFRGALHVLSLREAQPEGERNLAFNPYDSHGNRACFPHASANAETRGSSTFAAKNAINGNICSLKHGAWPYESWGINRDPAACLTVDFGRNVVVERLVLWTRADFPHDNFWREGEVSFSDNSSMTLSLKKTALPQEFVITPKTVSSIRLGKLVRDTESLSPYPALTQIEAWGHEACFPPSHAVFCAD